MSWQTVLGFEVHVELATNSKMFCGCPADHFGKPPNSQTCPVCLGLPGALPVPNIKAIQWCIKLGLALNCDINLFSKFDRKNYFYPDLPKGYQISQYDLPFCKNGSIELSSGKKIQITRVHMEEDTGKLQHVGDKTLVDFNRSGVPLVEIVTEPDFDNTDDATEYLKEIQSIIRFLEISSADMEKGSMRIEANISVRKVGDTKLPPFKVEVKNVNSFRFVKKAIEYEVSRQIEVLESGGIPVQETRGFNESKGITVSQRSKEEAKDYRYFPEPDIPPLTFTPNQITTWKKELPLLPAQIRSLLVSQGVSQQKANLVASDYDRYNMYTKIVQKGFETVKAIDIISNTPPDISNNLNKILDWAKAKYAAGVSNLDQLTELAKSVISTNPKVVLDIKAGKTQALFFLVGQMRKELPNIDVPTAQTILKKLILSND